MRVFRAGFTDLSRIFSTRFLYEPFCWVVSRSAERKRNVYYPRVSAEAEDVRYAIREFRVLIKNDFEV